MNDGNVVFFHYICKHFWDILSHISVYEAVKDYKVNY
jgi:hypothetical protein